MTKKIVILTGTRAEYGLLRPIIRALNECENLKVMIAVTGAHLSSEFGLTYKEIEADGIEIDRKIEILLGSDTPVSVSKAMGLAMISFSEYFDEKKPDALLVLGDRYETLAVCCAAMNARIPIFHLYGGETTEGAIDEAIRHSITKMSYLHFTAAENYRKRVIQLGEAPERVFNVGSIGVENVLTMGLLTKRELEESIGFDLSQPYAVVTFHPVTLENNDSKRQCKELLKVFESRSDLRFVITKANADTEGYMINHMLEEYVLKHKSQAVIFDSLGVQKYLSAVKYSKFVLGNSSSGIIEVPSLHVPTVNIGSRQAGRLHSESVVNCQPIYDDIMEAIKRVETEEFQARVLKMKNPYEGKRTSASIVRVISKYLMDETIYLKKPFYDL
ncbi:UDP-N-acetylglucosamine 2-epimerase [Lachnospiraceae bacterium 62-35]